MRLETDEKGFCHVTAVIMNIENIHGYIHRQYSLHFQPEVD